MNEDYFVLCKRNNGYFYYYVRDNFNRRVYRSTGQKTKAKALKVIAERIKDGELSGPKVTKHYKFYEYADNFWDYDTCPIIQEKVATGHHYSIRYAKDNATILEKYILPEFGQRYIEEITTGMIKLWMRKLPQRYGIRSKRANDCHNCLSAILKQAVLDGIITRNPAEGITKLAKDTVPHGNFTKEQIHSLFAERWDSLPIYTACLLAAKTGMRLGEIRALYVEDINEKEGYIRVIHNYAKQEGLKTTKAGYNRIVPIDQETIDLLKEIAPLPSGFIFTSNGKNPIYDHYFNDTLHAEMQKRNIPMTDGNGLPLSFHSFRVFFNTRLVVANLSSSKIRATIGHESEQMTQHYTKLNIDDMEQIREIQRAIG